MNSLQVMAHLIECPELHNVQFDFGKEYTGGSGGYGGGGGGGGRGGGRGGGGGGGGRQQLR